MKGPWRVLLTGGASGGEKPAAARAALDFNVGSDQPRGQAAGAKVTLNTPADTLKVGKNTVDFTLLDAAGKPVTGAKVTTSVAMTNMDMGTTHPQAREGKDGHYTTQVEFSMKGPWRVTLRVVPSNQQPFTKSFDFNVSE
jgi:nitrogen fixation protein FixH